VFCLPEVSTFFILNLDTGTVFFDTGYLQTFLF
jgi:hypothetical protein